MASSIQMRSFQRLPFAMIKTRASREALELDLSSVLLSNYSKTCHLDRMVMMNGPNNGWYDHDDLGDQAKTGHHAY